MDSLKEKFDHLFKIIIKDSFLKMEALGGEIPFFIASYDAQDELDCRHEITLIKRKLDNSGIPVLELNLYKIVCELLEANGGIERMFRVEKRRDKDKFLRALQSTLNLHDVLLPRIKEIIENHPDAKVFFLTGIGLVYPFIRSHTILNNLQNIAKTAPSVIFFPGEYDGNTLRLFDRLKDDNYYRAFNIFKIRA